MIKEKTYRSLEFDKILKKLADQALSDNAKNKAIRLDTYIEEATLRKNLKQTKEAIEYINNVGLPPLVRMDDFENILLQAKKQGILDTEKLNKIKSFIFSTIRMKKYLEKIEAQENTLKAYGRSIAKLDSLGNEIEEKIRGNEVADQASTLLSNIRRKLIFTEDKLKNKLKSLIINNKEYFQEEFIVLRNARYTLPVRSKFKRFVKGSVVEKSNKGGTYFIEPDSVKKYRIELENLKIEEDAEKRRILYEITGHVVEKLKDIKTNIEAMEELDFIFAKAKLSIEFDCVEPKINTERKIRLNKARHPLIPKDEVVALDFEIGYFDKKENIIKRVVITGPNTGGKTVAIKTVGLLALMAQSGLFVPAKEAEICMNNYILADIGDQQSISENLSTFSSHMTNIIEILKNVDEESLILLDELGSGTDPEEGMGIALAVLNEISKIGSLLVSSTHYPEVKEYAKTNNGFVNAKMTFDLENLKPLYRLEIGKAGESCALYISKQLGLPDEIINHAKEAIQYKKIEDKSSKRYLEKKNCLNKIIRIEKVDDTVEEIKNKFNIGDSVIVYPNKENGIIFSKIDEKGMAGVMIKNKKRYINHKRIKLRIPAKELYPEDYDFSIIFDTVEDRKVRKKMSKRHIPGLTVKIEDDINE